jgi:hypothetical protein
MENKEMAAMSSYLSADYIVSCWEYWLRAMSFLFVICGMNQ